MGNNIKRNTIFISGRQFAVDNELCEEIKDYLVSYGYNVIRYDRWGGYDEHDKDLKQTIQNGIFLPIITARYFESSFCMTELNYAIRGSGNIKPLVLPVIIGGRSALNIMPELCDYDPYIMDYNEYNIDKLKRDILKRLKNI